MNWAYALRDALGAPFQFIADYNVTRLVAVAMSLYLTFDSYVWAKHFAEIHAGAGGAEIALIVGAVLGAVSAMQTFILRLYLDDKRQG